MKYGWAAGLVVFAAACAPVKEESRNSASSVKSEHSAAMKGAPKPEIPPRTGSIAPETAAPAYPPEPARTTRWNGSGVVFEGVAFDSRTHQLVVVDQAGGPGSEFHDAQSAAGSRGGIAAVNAGFFTPGGDPLGWVIAGGKRSGAWNSASSLGSGVWHQDRVGRSAISRREALGRTGAAAMFELLQAGPMLVENERAVTGLEASKSSVRTVIAWDGVSRWWIGRSSPCTLESLAKLLSQAGPAGWKVRHALNLDGGRSADLWASGQVAGGPLLCRAPWNRPVRNFLVLVAR